MEHRHSHMMHQTPSYTTIKLDVPLNISIHKIEMNDEMDGWYKGITFAVVLLLVVVVVVSHL